MEQINQNPTTYDPVESALTSLHAASGGDISNMKDRIDYAIRELEKHCSMRDIRMADPNRLRAILRDGHIRSGFKDLSVWTRPS